jgi:NAD(P)H-dependent FMN reductase
MIHVLALSGSLRASSVNTALLRACARLTPADMNVTLFEAMDQIPLFNPDNEGHETSAVLLLREALKNADAVIIASPEYAHGVTGVIKNALDWVVGSGELEAKPLALLNASKRSTYAPAALRETLTIMGAHVLDSGSPTLSLSSNQVSEEQALAMPDVTTALQGMLSALAQAIEVRALECNAP